MGEAPIVTNDLLTSRCCITTASRSVNVVGRIHCIVIQATNKALFTVGPRSYQVADRGGRNLTGAKSNNRAGEMSACTPFDAWVWPHGEREHHQHHGVVFRLGGWSPRSSNGLAPNAMHGIFNKTSPGLDAIRAANKHVLPLALQDKPLASTLR